MARTSDCDPATRGGRFNKAEQFVAAAELVAEFADGVLADVEAAYVTLLVHAGIAASDVICCASLGQYSTGENHTDAVALLKQVDINLSADLGVLLSLKTRAGYSAQSLSADSLARAARACARMMTAARKFHQPRV